MLYLESAYKMLNGMAEPAEKIFLDSIQPFVETPPKENEPLSNQIVEILPADLFISFTADIINKNVVFTR